MGTDFLQILVTLSFALGGLRPGMMSGSATYCANIRWLSPLAFYLFDVSYNSLNHVAA